MKISEYISKLESLRKTDWKSTGPEKPFIDLSQVRQSMLYNEGLLSEQKICSRQDVEILIAKFNKTRASLTTDLEKLRKTGEIVVNMADLKRSMIIPPKIPIQYSMLMFRVSSNKEVADILEILSYIEATADNFLNPSYHLKLYASEIFLLWCSLVTERRDYIVSEWEFAHNKQRKHRSWQEELNLQQDPNFSYWAVIGDRDKLKEMIWPAVERLSYLLECDLLGKKPSEIEKYLPLWVSKKMIKMIRMPAQRYSSDSFSKTTERIYELLKIINKEK